MTENAATTVWLTPQVLGDAWVDKSIAARFVQRRFIRFDHAPCWGKIWTRPHFDHRTRRVLGSDYGRPDNGTSSAFTSRAALTEGGFTPRRYQGNIAAAGDLLRRAAAPRGQGGLRGTRGLGLLKDRSSTFVCDRSAQFRRFEK